MVVWLLCYENMIGGSTIVPLQNISKLRVLIESTTVSNSLGMTHSSSHRFISQIILVRIFISLRSTRPVSLPVLPDTHKPVDKYSDACNERGQNNNNETRHVARGVFLFENKWTGEIPWNDNSASFSTIDHRRTNKKVLPRQYPMYKPDDAIERFVYPATLAICNPMRTAYPPPTAGRI